MLSRLMMAATGSPYVWNRVLTLNSLAVIVPVTGAGRYLHQSVMSALQHDDLLTEVVVVMNGANENLHDELGTLNTGSVQVISLPEPVGAAAARNVGIAASTANWIRFLDADDRFLPGSTSRLLSLIEDPNRDIAVGRMRLVDENGTQIQDMDNTSPAIGAVLCSRGLFHAVGTFDEALKLGEFIDWISRARRSAIRERATAHLVLERRVHVDNSSTQGLRSGSPDYLRVARAHLKRNR
jgi:glycosyltransferase involved in cell wall biosynthesis